MTDLLTPEQRDRFNISFVPVPESGCWIWERTLNSKGYGVLPLTASKRSRYMMAHRASYELHVGEIPEGSMVCHKCDVRACVNPSHLFVGTHNDNMRDMIEKGRSWSQRKQYCRNGHKFTANNTHINNLGYRVCRQCRARIDRRRRANRRLKFLRDVYGIPAKRGMRVEIDGALGTITGGRRNRVMVQFDGFKQPKPFHPTKNIRYLTQGDSK